MLRKVLELLFRLYRSFRKWLFARSWLRKYFADLRNISGFQDQGTHEVMLSDQVRVDRYYEAIARAVEPGDVVLDLGAGTGILSYFAAQKAREVYAVEHAPIIEVAKRICAANGIKNVQFFPVNSRDFQPPAKVDVIVHEQIAGGNPFSENMLENLVDARRRLLKPGGKIVPNQFEIFLEPVELNQAYRIPFLWEFEIHSIRFQSLRPEPQELPANGRPILPQHTRRIYPGAIKCCLCSPRPILSFDLESLELADLPKRIDYENVAVRAGRIDGLCLYFKSRTQGCEFLENGPNRAATHWAMGFFRTEETLVDAGNAIAYDLAFGAFDQATTWAIQWLQPARK